MRGDKQFSEPQLPCQLHQIMFKVWLQALTGKAGFCLLRCPKWSNYFGCCCSFVQKQTTFFCCVQKLRPHSNLAHAHYSPIRLFTWSISHTTVPNQQSLLWKFSTHEYMSFRKLLHNRKKTKKRMISCNIF